ncbi:Sulfatase, putative [Giardia lamblia P15]|uniref:Sulfatase, putative n=1 Tax=Giardia intestinalis (strain P15) TaxID=658858 RepID=E1F848_GIAIA|nr:Sulfatase, putative [Giardia lamblia P15]
MKRCIVRRELLPGPFLIPIVAFPFTILLSFLKFFGSNTSQRKILPLSAYFLLMILMSFVELGALSFTFALLHYIFCQKLPLPTIFINTLLIVLCLGLFAGTLYDVESAREYQGILTLSILQTYVFHVSYPSWPLPDNYIVGRKAPTGGIEVLFESIRLHYQHWIIVFGVLAILVVAAIVVLVMNWDAFVFSLFSRRTLVAQHKRIPTRADLADKSLRVLNSIGGFSVKAPPAIYQFTKSILFYPEQSIATQSIEMQKAQTLPSVPRPQQSEATALGSYTPDVATAPRRQKFPVKLYDNLFISPEFLLAAVCAVFYTILLLVMILRKSVLPTFLDRGAPMSYMFLKQMGPYQASLFSSEETYAAMVQRIRSQYTLPPEECWLDQREPPVYPLLHAPRDVCCAYNRVVEGVDCTALRSGRAGLERKLMSLDSELQSESPNVVILLWESLSLSPYFYTDAFLQGQEQLLRSADGMLKATIVPNLQRFVEDGISFVNSAALGLPTVSGWHSLMTGLVPNFYGVNMITSAVTDVYGLPQFFSDAGYKNFYISPSSFAFDGKDAWVARPGWFTDVVYYHPTDEQAEELGLDPESVPQTTSWVADRITNRQFIATFSSLTEKDPTKPILGVYMNVDTHTPFDGFDKEEFYSDEVLDGMIASCQADPETPECRLLLDPYIVKYARVLKYSDKYFLGKTLEFLEAHHPNTIVVIVGDHGTRVSIDKKRLRKGVSDVWTYNEECLTAAFLDDNAFVTGAYVRYLGGPGKGPYNARVYEFFENWKGAVYTGTTDNREVVHLAYLLAVDETRRTKVPSYRLMRNLADVLQNASLGRALSPWHSVSSVGLGVEYRTERTLYRTNSQDQSGALQYGGIKGLTCIDITDKDLEQAYNGQVRTSHTLRVVEDSDMYNQAIELVQFHNFLLTNGRVFHKSFYNMTCVDESYSTGVGEPRCSFPTPDGKRTSQWLFGAILGVMAVISAAVGGVLSSVAYCWRYRHLHTKLKEKTTSFTPDL